MTMLFDMLHKTNGPKTNAQTQTATDDASAMSPGGDPLEVARRVAAAMRSGAAAPSTSLSYISSSPTAASAVYNNAGATMIAPPANYPTAMGATAAALPPPPSADTPEVTSMAMAKVSTLVERGKMNDAQATAVTEFLKGKEEAQKNGGIAALADAEMLQNRATAFEVFKQSYKGYEKVEEMKRQLKVMYEACKITGREANVINDRIKHIKKEILKLRAERAVAGVEEVSSAEQDLLEQLREEKQGFTTYIEKVKKQKEEIQSVEAFLERSKEQLSKNFEDWMNVRQRQVQLAMQAMHSDPSASTSAGQSPAPAPGHIDSSTKTGGPPPPPPTLATVAPSPLPTAPPPPPPSSAPHVYSSTVSSVTGWHPSSAPSQPQPPSQPHAFAASTKELSAAQRTALQAPPPPVPLSSSPSPTSSSVHPHSLYYASPTGAAAGGWVGGSNAGGGGGAGGAGAGGGGGPANLSLGSGRTRSTNAFHLEPLSPALPGVGAAPAPAPGPSTLQPTLSSGYGVGGGPASSARTMASGGYAPVLPRSTGDPTADQELAALYRAREAMRRNLGG